MISGFKIVKAAVPVLPEPVPEVPTASFAPVVALPVSANPTPTIPSGKKLPKLSKDFLFAGRALFTVNNDKGEHYTFSVRKAKHRLPNATSEPLFVSLKVSDADNVPMARYGKAYLGILRKDGTIVSTYASALKPEDKRFKVAEWALKSVVNGTPIPVSYEIAHAGKCGKCARTLTDPVSIERGIGPECWSGMHR